MQAAGGEQKELSARCAHLRTQSMQKFRWMRRKLVPAAKGILSGPTEYSAKLQVFPSTSVKCPHQLRVGDVGSGNALTRRQGRVLGLCHSSPPP